MALWNRHKTAGRLSSARRRCSLRPLWDPSRQVFHWDGHSFRRSSKGNHPKLWRVGSTMISIEPGKSHGNHHHDPCQTVRTVAVYPKLSQFSSASLGNHGYNQTQSVVGIWLIMSQKMPNIDPKNCHVDLDFTNGSKIPRIFLDHIWRRTDIHM